MSIQLTEAAARRVQRQLGERGHGFGLRLAVKPSGCSGYAYVLDYADETGPDDVVYETHGARLVVAKEALPMLDGLVLDFRREGLNEVFRFENPNAEALCGCGESFSLGKTGT